MRLYSIFVSPADDADSAPEVVADRFSWPAFLVTPIWLLSHRLWLAFTLWLVAVAMLVGASLFLGSEPVVWVYLLLAMLVGFEAPSLRRAKLLRRGFRPAGERFASDEAAAVIASLSEPGLATGARS
jgi:hypothetical protein